VFVPLLVIIGKDEETEDEETEDEETEDEETEDGGVLLFIEVGGGGGVV
jgi:hypothetical protein